MKRYLLYLSVLCWGLLGACTENPFGNDEEPLPGGSDSTQVQIEIDQTDDGQAPYVKVDSQVVHYEAHMGAIGEERIGFQTNMVNRPTVELILDDPTEEFVRILDVGQTSLNIKLDNNHTDKQRIAHILFKTHTDSLLNKMTVVQGRGATFQLVEEKATINSLNFRYQTNGMVREVHYALSHKMLDEIDIYSFLNGHGVDPKLDQVGEMYLKDGTNEFTLSFEGLRPNSPYYLYVASGFCNGRLHYSSYKYYQSKNVATAQFESQHDLVMTVSANPANNFTVVLPFGNAIEGTVNWGDGTSERFDQKRGMIQHTYNVTKAKNFSVRFSGHLESLHPEPYAPNSSRESTLIAITQWGLTGLRRIDLGGFTSLSSIATDTEGAFATMEHFGVEPYGGSFSDTNIESIPADLFKYAVNVTSFDNTFRGCKKLKTIPRGLFMYNTNATSFSRTFGGNEQLQAIPKGLFDHATKATDFNHTFYGCTSLTEIPAGLFNYTAKTTDFEGTFYGCTSLKAIPARLFAHTPEAQNFAATFARCKALETIPADLFANCYKAYRFGKDPRTDQAGGFRGSDGVFQECVRLKSIPEDLFSDCPSAVDFSFAFYGCSGLQSIPANLFSHNPNLARLRSTFANCGGLTSLPHSLFDNNRALVSVESTFSGCGYLAGESPYTIIRVDNKDVKVHLYERRHYPFEFANLQYYHGCFSGCIHMTDYDNMIWK